MSAMANRGYPGAGAAGERRQKILLAVLSVVLVALLAWQLPKLLGGGGSSTTASGDTTSAVAVATPVADATAASAAGTAAAPTTGVPTTSRAALRKITRQIKKMPARDPFVPLIGATTVAPAAPTATPAPTPTPTPEPVKPAAPAIVPTAAVIWTNGRRQVIRVNQQFQVGDTTSRLVAVTRNSVKLEAVVGAFEGGSRTITLKRTLPLTFENTVTGVQYSVRFSLAMTAVPGTSEG